MPEPPDTTSRSLRLPSPAKCVVVVVSLLVVGLLIGGWRWHQSARTAILTIEAAGGETWGISPAEYWLSNHLRIRSSVFRWTCTDADIYHVVLRDVEVSETIIRSLRSCTYLLDMEVTASSLSPAMRELDQLRLPRFKGLAIYGRVDALQLAHLRNIRAIKFIDFLDDGQSIHSMTADALEELQYLPELEGIGFVRVALESPLPRSVSRMNELTFLSYYFDDEGTIVLPKDAWVHLKHLPRLDEFTLNYASVVTDDALEEASKLDGLTTLIANGNDQKRFTDTGLEHVARLKSLKQATLLSLHITAAGIERLRAALPDCAIDVPWSDSLETESMLQPVTTVQPSQ